MKQAAAGCATIIIAVGAIAFLLMVISYRIVDRFTDWRVSANEATVMQEQTDQVQIHEEQATLRYNKYADVSLEIVKEQEKGLTERNADNNDTTYWTSWTSIGHRILTILLIVAGALWVMIIIGYLGRSRRDTI